MLHICSIMKNMFCEQKKPACFLMRLKPALETTEYFHLGMFMKNAKHNLVNRDQNIMKFTGEGHKCFLPLFLV